MSVPLPLLESPKSTLINETAIPSDSNHPSGQPDSRKLRSRYRQSLNLVRTGVKLVGPTASKEKREFAKNETSCRGEWVEVARRRPPCFLSLVRVLLSCLGYRVTSRGERDGTYESSPLIPHFQFYKSCQVSLRIALEHFRELY